jgi:lipase maturation factor 1
VLSAAAAVLILAVSLSVLIGAQARRPLPRPLDAVAAIAPAFGIGSLYHLFPTMQTERHELQIGASYDGVTWQVYEFRYKPGELKKAPPFIVPHQPRLDWMMWFLPPQWPDTGYWFPHFLDALRQNKPAVTRLLAHNPFEGKAPPNLLRVEVFRYRFTTAQERARTGNWWNAEYLGQFPDVPPRRP